ncbi:MAG: 4Fe-4S dicluster domain-containing protein [Bacteroidia bacterium]|nr:4Fe-4S dicluster domain-containing protein [Bacteroidia bacterium]
MTRIDPGFASEITKYGASDFNACFNCGNCTAICGLTANDANFPRMFIRYGMLGLKEEILKSKELWLCYACGDCSETCPRQAAPGNYMAALHRYAIASYEPTGLTKLLFKNKLLFILFTSIMALVLGVFLFTLKPDHVVSRWIFKMIPYAVIHNMGLVIFTITGMSIIWGLLNMFLRLKSNKSGEAKKNSCLSSWKEVFGELATMKRYRTCDLEEDSYWKDKPAFQKPWFIHWSVMWGFIGLLAATLLDFLLKDPATTTWWPARILGTLAGLFLIYGTSMMLLYRSRKATRSYAETNIADNVFLWFLWIAGFTGFWMEISVFFTFNHPANHYILLVHTIISMELVLLFAFSKFAHAVYRPLALFYYFRENLSNN